MELESNKYKKRLNIIVIILIISTILASIVEQQLRKELDTIDKITETIQGTTEEQFNEEMEKRKTEGKEIPNYYESKEKALSTMQKLQENYAQIFKHSKGSIILIETIGISGSIIAIMMYVIISDLIVKKVIPNIKNWLSIIIRVAILIIMLPIPACFYTLITIGVFGQLPFVAYTLYKYIKIKNAEDKDDVIKEK